MKKKWRCEKRGKKNIFKKQIASPKSEPRRAGKEKGPRIHGKLGFLPESGSPDMRSPYDPHEIIDKQMLFGVLAA